MVKVNTNIEAKTGEFYSGQVSSVFVPTKSFEQIRLEEAIEEILESYKCLKDIEIDDEVEYSFKEVVISSLLINSYFRDSIYSNKYDVPKTPKELIEIMDFRSSTFKGVDYFKDSIDEPIKGLNYDNFDSNSIILFSKEDNELVSTARIILDSNMGLPSENYSNLVSRNREGVIAEISRLCINPSKRKSRTFLDIFGSMYNLGLSNNISSYYFSVVNSDASMYLKFGGVEILEEGIKYGNVPKGVSLLEWKLAETNSKYRSLFKKPLIEQKLVA